MIRFLESLTVIFIVLAVSLTDDTPALIIAGWFAVALALVAVTAYLGGFRHGK